MKFSCQYFGLKIGRVLWNTQIHFFGNFGVVRGYRLAEKGLEPKKTKYVVSALWTPHQEILQLW